MQVMHAGVVKGFKCTCTLRVRCARDCAGTRHLRSLRFVTLTLLHFRGTMLLAPHDSASKAGSDLKAALSGEDCCEV